MKLSESEREQRSHDLTVHEYEAYRGQSDALQEALDTMLHRTGSYGLVWQQYGALSNLLNAARKVDRLMNIWWHENDGDTPAIHKDALDDAIDAINYLGFFIQCAQAGNLTGSQPNRPHLELVPDRVPMVPCSRRHSHDPHRYTKPDGDYWCDGVV